MIRDTIERLAREAAERVGNDAGLAWDTKELTEYIQTIIIAILTDPQVGFKEALEWQSGFADTDEQCCEADEKLAELKELSK